MAKVVNRKKFLKAFIEDHNDNPVLCHMRECEGMCALYSHLPTPKPTDANDQARHWGIELKKIIDRLPAQNEGVTK